MEEHKTPRSNGSEAENQHTLERKAVKVVWRLCNGIWKQKKWSVEW